jgi:hypothetical protein
MNAGRFAPGPVDGMVLIPVGDTDEAEVVAGAMLDDDVDDVVVAAVLVGAIVVVVVEVVVGAVVVEVDVVVGAVVVVVVEVDVVVGAVVVVVVVEDVVVVVEVEVEVEVDVDDDVDVVVVVGGAVLQAEASGGVTGALTTLVTVPSWVSKIWEPVGVVSKNTIGAAALDPMTLPWVDVVPVNRYSPEPLTAPVLTKFVPLVKPSLPCV